jgi:hypothetical protein
VTAALITSPSEWSRTVTAVAAALTLLVTSSETIRAVAPATAEPSTAQPAGQSVVNRRAWATRPPRRRNPEPPGSTGHHADLAGRRAGMWFPQAPLLRLLRLRPV